MSLVTCGVRSALRVRVLNKSLANITKASTSVLPRCAYLPFRYFCNSSLLQGRLFTESHEWVLLSDDKSSASIGISDHAQSALGDVVFVELPEIGKEVSVGEDCGLVESTKSVSSIYSPVTGEVTETNTALEEDPSLVNKSPYKQGWICKLKVTPDVSSEIEGLMTEESYDKFLNAEDA
ncbi:glycine cleavage system H protein-like [Convolutriloba macropyga]|uniref:glycine cleavage system H protein-like n=1 Tax=Convolutriloba macropyga TaxID=536237 RepID=UPI003F528F8A